MDSRSLDLFVKILLEIDEIEKRKTEFHIDEAAWSSSRAMRDLILMPLIQIGEFTTHFKDGSHVALFPQVPWREIRGFRNVVVHGYGQIDPDAAWETATNGVAELRSALLGNAEVACAYGAELDFRASSSTGNDAASGVDSLIEGLPSAD